MIIATRQQHWPASNHLCQQTLGLFNNHKQCYLLLSSWQTWVMIPMTARGLFHWCTRCCLSSWKFSLKLAFCSAAVFLFACANDSVLPRHFGEFLKSKQFNSHPSHVSPLHMNTCKSVHVLPLLKRRFLGPAEQPLRLSGNLLFI